MAVGIRIKLAGVDAEQFDKLEAASRWPLAHLWASGNTDLGTQPSK